ncbi:hypothetical protein IWW38_004270 [Coemansia aciculifera]|uniref:Uncharacterized protein n=1 Tax=Coemansia aciculifera TaxID=417176 RepID=A0ACC1LY28_9FUNG|nr:hypothetical protein IWW38_004270 [Coemansia aciculifera]
MSLLSSGANTDADGFTRVVAKGKRGQSSRVSHLPPIPNSDSGNSARDDGADSKPQSTVFPGKRRPRNRRQQQQQQTKSIVETQVEGVLEKIESLKSAKFFDTLQETTLDLVQAFGPEEIVCYGVGSLATQISQWQLALILLINQHLNIGMSAFDPVTLPTDCETLERFAVSIIAENEEARRSVTVKTLFFMPHCEEFLYDNLLAANWSPEQLTRILIIGNRISRYQDTQSSKELAEKSPYILHAIPAIACTDLPSERLLGLRNCPYAFTDTCVQQFGGALGDSIDFNVVSRPIKK